MKNRKIRLFLIIAFLLLAVFVSFLLFTPSGSRGVARHILGKYADKKNVSLDKTKGNLFNGVSYNNLELRNIKGLPEGSILRIQSLFLKLTSLNLDSLTVEIENARLLLPDSDPIVLSGKFKRQKMDINIFSRGFTVNEVLGYLPDLKNLIPLKGEIDGVDLYIKGSTKEPEIAGDFLIKKFIYKGFVLSDTPCNVAVTLKDIEREVKLFGNVTLGKGKLNTQKIVVNLESGKINFSGPWNEPSFTFVGNSKVEKTKINISLKGTLEKPDLNLTSEPSYSKQKLMVMLATGKSWQSVEDTMDTGVISKDLTKDFIDYFLFAGRGNRFSEKFGVRDFTVKFEKGAKGIGAKKDLTDKLEIGYDVEQKTVDEKTSTVSQKVQGEYKITDEISVGAERETVKEKNNDILDGQTPETKSNDKVYLKYEKSF